MTTNIILIIDKSGSMHRVTQDTIGGYNSYLDGLKGRNVRLSAMMFDTNFKVLYKNRLPNKATRLTDKNYKPSGNTALWDAIGKTLSELEFGAHEKVMYVIITDGQENSSKEWTSHNVKKLIGEKERAGQEFVYLSASPEAWLDSAVLGLEHKTFYSAMDTGVDNRYMWSALNAATNTVASTSVPMASVGQVFRTTYKNELDKKNDNNLSISS